MSQNKIIFRADGNSNIGLGHIYRVLALAQMLSSDYDITVATRADSIHSLIPERYRKLIIPTDVSIEQEPNWFLKKFQSDSHIIVLDGYCFDAKYQKELKNRLFTLFYIDDLCNPNQYADVIINHAIVNRKNNYKNVPSYTRLALGPEYCMLRSKFLESAKKHRQINSITNIFVSFGGADFNNITVKCLEGIKDISSIKNINVLIGPAFDKAYAKFIKDNYSDKVYIHQGLKEEEITNLMSKSDLAIVPSSTIAYEVCCVKMPIISGYYINNQHELYNGLVKKELIFGVGNFNELEPKDFRVALENILELPKKDILKQIHNQKEAFDGNQRMRFISLFKQYDR